MRLIFLFTCVLLVNISTSVYSQDRKFTFSVEDKTIKDVFRMIEKESELRFLYNDDFTDLNKKVTIDVTDNRIESILDLMLNKAKVTYRILENNLVVITPLGMAIQDITITGTVTDEAGETLPGVTVLIKGANQGTVTDIDGRYSVNVPDESATLVFSFVGYASQEFVIGARRVINATFIEESRGLEEVVVVGYGTQRKVNLTGAVSVISGEDIASKASTDIRSAMQGQLPGVFVLRNNGKPGQETNTIRIRGFTSTNAASALILIDGVEGGLTTLNPEDIESITVLKDGASASIYGSRAAAGVILVTTKKGAVQRTAVSYNGSFGINVPGMMPERVAPWIEQEMINIARFNNTGAPEYTPEQSSWVGNPNFNYYPNGNRWSMWGNSNFLHEGLNEYTTQQNHSVSVRGGNEKTKYYFSGGYYAKNGILKYGPDDYRRVNLRSSIDTEFNQYLDFNLQVSYEETLLKENPAASTIMTALYSTRGRQPIYLPEEDTNVDGIYSSDLFDFENPIQLMNEAGLKKTQNQILTVNATLRIKNVIKGLTLDLNASRRAYFSNGQTNSRYVPGYGRNGFLRREYNKPNSVSKLKDNSNQDKLEALLNYDLKMNHHHIHILGGATYEQYRREQISGTARSLLSNDFFSFGYYANDVATNSSLDDLVQPWKMASLFGRLNYDFAGRYLLETTLRYDGSSRLPSGSRWGLFPSVSAGWRISEEAFFESARQIVGNLKLRASWGQLGNSSMLNTMYYPYLGFITPSTYWGNSVYYQNEMVSTDVSWETVTSTNLGVDVGLLNNRLSLTADYYWKKNDGMLAQLRVGNIVGIAGAGLPYENAGVLKTWGWELSAQWRDRIGDVSYQVGFNIDDSQNELVSYRGANVIAAGAVSRLEGYPINSLWGYQTDGFWTSRQEYLDYKTANPGYETFNQDAKIEGGDTRYVAQGKADHKIGIGGGTPEDPGDLVLLGNTSPRYTFGINLGAQWRRFDFSMFWQGVGSREILLSNGSINPFSAENLMPWTIHLDYWTKDNPNAYFARLVENQSYNYQPSDRWLQNGAYIRLKNIQLGYTIPIPKKIINSLRIYVVGTDVWEHTKMLKAYDPEAGNNQDRTYYPFFRTWTFGINLTF
ncbi:MAG: TonB-dependent receptor [Tannerella sp.]|jgi:TonB-linked SusC/RagA family outer membrane protein|nr:TonB-dependent receptor [Tannerella sp.]